jgi:hypothetical protein
LGPLQKEGYGWEVRQRTEVVRTFDLWECERCYEDFPLTRNAQSGTTRDQALNMGTFDEESKDLRTCVK